MSKEKDYFCLSVLYFTGAFLNKGTWNPSSFTPETNKISDDNCTQGGWNVKGEHAAPESIKKVILFSLNPTSRFIQGSW
jgi:hypothetical protein